jgi:hypothetical protein
MVYHHHRVGNDVVAEDLYSAVLGITQSLKEINEAINQKLSEDLKQSQQSSINVMRAALAGTKLAKSD